MSQSLGSYPKHHSAKRAFKTHLRNLGTNTVSNLSGASSPSGITVTSVTFDTTTSQVVALLDSGVAGVDYDMTIQFDLSNGEHVVYEFTVQVY